MNDTKKLLNNLNKSFSQPHLTPIATEVFIPNHSGTHDAGIKNLTPVKDNDLVNKKYVDDSIGAIDLSGLVPYTGATTDVDLGAKKLTTTGIITADGGFVSDPIDYDFSGIVGNNIVNKFSTSVDLDGNTVMGAVNVISPSEPYVNPPGSGLAFFNTVPIDALGGAGDVYGIFGVNAIRGPDMDVVGDGTFTGYGAFFDTYTTDNAALYYGIGAYAAVEALGTSYISEATALNIHIGKVPTSTIDNAIGLLINDIPTDTTYSSYAIKTGIGDVLFGDDIYAEADLYVNDDLIGTKPDGVTKITNGAFTGSATGWTLASGWTYGSNIVTHSSNGVGGLSQTSAGMITPLIVGQRYKLTYTVARTAGSVTPSIAGVTLDTKSISGTHSQEFVALSTADLVFTPTNTTRLSIDDVILETLGVNVPEDLFANRIRMTGTGTSNRMYFGTDNTAYIYRSNNDLLIGASSGRVALIGTPYIETLNTKCGTITGDVTNADSGVFAIHQPDESYYGITLYNDAYDDETPIFTTYIYDSGKMTMGTEVETDLAFYTNGYSNERLVIKSGGDVELSHTIKPAGGYKSSDGTAGATGTQVIVTNVAVDGDGHVTGITTKTITYKNGLITDIS